MNLKAPSVSMLELLLISIVFTPASGFTFTSTKVKLHEAATLPCYDRCSGLVTWFRPSNKEDILAQCNQTLCQTKIGFQMSHGQYMKGNLSLTVTEADFSKRDWYTCMCNGKDICYVSLRLESFSFQVHVQAGESLTLDLPIPDEVEVTFNKTDGPNTRLCKIEKHKAQCESVYEKRVSVGSNLQLKEVKNHDGGIYIIRDIKNDEVIGTYVVTVEGTNPDTKNDLPVEGTSPSQDGLVAAVLAGVFGVLLLAAIVVIVVLLVKNRRLQKCLRQRQNGPISMQQVQQGVEPPEQLEDVPEVAVRSPVMETDAGQLIPEQKMQHDSENEAGPEEDDPLLETDSPGNPLPVTDEPTLPHPIPDSCSELLPSSQTRVF